jgi:hypothetical protein
MERIHQAWIASPRFSERNMLHWATWYEMTAQHLILVAIVLWDLPASVASMAFGSHLCSQHWWLVGPVYVRCLAALVQFGAGCWRITLRFFLVRPLRR